MTTPTPQDMERAREVEMRWRGGSMASLRECIAQAIADERERCVKICEDYALEVDADEDDPSFSSGLVQGASSCAAAIRSGGDHA